MLLCLYLACTRALGTNNPARFSRTYAEGTLTVQLIGELSEIVRISVVPSNRAPSFHRYQGYVVGAHPAKTVGFTQIDGVDSTTLRTPKLSLEISKTICQTNLFVGGVAVRSDI